MRTSSGRIARSTGILASAIGLSRVLGFVRDLLLAGLFGTTAQAQAFVVAFRLPNLLRDLVAEGAVTSAFVPVLSWYRAKGKPGEFWQLSQALFCRLLVLLCALGVAGSLAAPWIVRLIAPGFAEEPEKFALTVRLTRLLFPFITLVGLWAYFMGVLNSLGRFAMPALGPAILNLAMIIACVWFVPKVEPGIVAVTVGVMVGGVIQLLIQIPVAVRMGFRWAWRWHHPGSRDILRLLGPRMVGSAVYQVSVLIDTALASLAFIVGPGAVAALYYANRLVQLPLAVFGTASAQASLPLLSSMAAHGDLNAFHATLVSVIRMVGFVVIPSAVGLMVLAFPIVGGLFERGAFDRQATIMTAQALICYAPGLLAFSLSKSLTGAFYALRETRAPVKLAIHAMALNVLLSLALIWPLRIMGLALAASITNTVNGYRLLRAMEARLGRPILEPVSASLARITGAALVMGLGCWLMWGMAARALPAWLGLMAVIPCGGVFYLAACKILGVPELASVFRWIKRD